MSALPPLQAGSRKSTLPAFQDLGFASEQAETADQSDDIPEDFGFEDDDDDELELDLGGVEYDGNLGAAPQGSTLARQKANGLAIDTSVNVSGVNVSSSRDDDGFGPENETDPADTGAVDGADLVDKFPQARLPEFRALIDPEKNSLNERFQEALQQLFIRFDEDGDEALNATELSALYAATKGVEIDEHTRQWIFNTYTCDDNGNLDMDGFFDLYFQQAYNAPVDVYEEMIDIGFGAYVGAEESEDRGLLVDDARIAIVPKSFGIKYSPAEIIMVYDLMDEPSGRVVGTRYHTMSLSEHTKSTPIDLICDSLVAEHRFYIHPTYVSLSQLRRLVEKVQPHLRK